MRRKSWFFTWISIMLITSMFDANADDVISWKFQTGGEIYATPVEHGGRIYIGSRDRIFYAIDAVSGEEVWRFEVDDPIHSTAAIEDDILVFESSNTLYGLTLDGELIWQVPLYAESVTDQIDSWDFFHSSPTISDSVAYIGTEKGLIYGVSIETGEIVFQVQTQEKSTIRIAPLIYDGKLYIGDWAGILYVYDIATATLLWQYDTRNDVTFEWTNAIQTPLVIHDGVLYFGGRSCNAYALNAESGQRLWMYSDHAVWIVGGTSLSDDLVYFGSSNQSLLYALDTASGESRWNASLDHRMWNAPLVSGDHLFFGSKSFFALDRQSGEIVNRMFFDPDSVHPETIPIIWLGSEHTGEADALANFHSSAIECENNIIVGCDDGAIYAFDRDAFLQMPHSNTYMEEEDSYIQLEDLPNSQTMQFEFTVYNTGMKEDSVWISLTSSTDLKSVTRITPEAFRLPAQDSIAVQVQIAPVDLREKTYSMALQLNSIYNLQKNSYKQTYRIKIIPATGIDDTEKIVPSSFSLHQNQPNPFNPTTRISYEVPYESEVRLDVYDIVGRKISTLVEKRQNSGNHSVYFNGSHLESGLYFCVLKAGSERLVRKMVLSK